MSNSEKYWDCNVSNKTKKAVMDALGADLDRQTEMDEKLAVIGRDDRKRDAKKKCAERRAKREALNSQANAKLSHPLTHDPESTMIAKLPHRSLRQAAESGLREASCSSSSILKRRMQLKRMGIQIEKNAALNFGYDPSDINHHELIDRRNELSRVVSKTDPEWWAIYDRYHYDENCKQLMVFLPTNAECIHHETKP